MSETTDRLYERVLVLRCQGGDEAAFAEIVDRYTPRLRYYLHKMLREGSEAEDALQDVWLAVFRGIARLVDADAFRAWLYRIARDRAVRELRRHRLPSQPLAALEPVDERTEEASFAADEIQRIHAGLDEMGAEQREVLVLRYIEAMSYEEIARVVGCPLGTVRSRLYHAKRALREVLERNKSHD
jgi:RNA polymerase sigma-70 factor (ECF subfamily)